MKKISLHSLKPGFTLVELLIVMVILGVILAIGGGSYMSSLQKSRDARRKSDLDQIRKALEVYYNDTGQYPLSSADGYLLACNGGSACTWGETFQDSNGTVYMIELPDDPTSNYQYRYVSADGSEYQLYARLENTEDRDVPKDVNDDPQVYGSLTCGAAGCNYGVSSANTTPETGVTLVTE